jgi:hypothetical protein
MRWRSCVRYPATAMVPLLSPGMLGLAARVSISGTRAAPCGRADGAGVRAADQKITRQSHEWFLPQWGFFPAFRPLNWADTTPKFSKVIVRRAFIA